MFSSQLLQFFYFIWKSLINKEGIWQSGIYNLWFNVNMLLLTNDLRSSFKTFSFLVRIDAENVKSNPSTALKNLHTRCTNLHNSYHKEKLIKILPPTGMTPMRFLRGISITRELFMLYAADLGDQKQVLKPFTVPLPSEELKTKSR